MLLLFPGEPFNLPQVEPVYAAEAVAAEQLGLAWAVIDLEALIDGAIKQALRRVPTATAPTLAVYRGWMLSLDQYQQLSNGLAARNYQLINDPASYTHCHHLPNVLPLLGNQTPASIVFPQAQGLDAASIAHEAAGSFGQQALIIKDYVKSRKYEWHEACFIPNASDQAQSAKVIQTFIERQGADLVGGVVLRAWHALEIWQAHQQSGLALAYEYRSFWLDGRLLWATPYWDHQPSQPTPDWARYAELAQQVQSRFWTLDLALTQTGAWLIIELGDGQVSGLPDHASAHEFLHALAQRLAAT
ncbi:ATP-grasp domain-containing protein [Herpetosiphon llansteffanensis]|uniref:ATP-grasp domain-containing protein n=1 Tax=Herpetosiphon llansteffanensis TaxID=2094568 RepID=UPI000D7C8B81|nr:ATP-grasp domain-containing protein [Herpetosiphon llansteffanensis]